MSETWRAIPGFEGLYEVSDLGRVRSLDRVILQRSRWGTLYKYRKRGKTLRPGPATAGHLTVMLGRDGGTKLVHALVVSAFIGPRPAGTEVRHKNGVETDNRLSNLEYATRSRNGQDKKWHKGQSTYRLNPQQAADILTRLRRGEKGVGAQLSREYGVAQSTISAIKHGRFHNDVRASL